MTDRPVGGPECNCGVTVQAMIRLKINAAQYGGKISQARRSANRTVPPSRHPRRAGAMAEENPDSTMKATAARCPYTSQPSQAGPVLAGYP